MAPQIEEHKSSKDATFDHLGDSSFLKGLNAMVGEPKKDLSLEQDDTNTTKRAKAIVKTKNQGVFDFIWKLLLRKMKFNKGKGNRT